MHAINTKSSDFLKNMHFGVKNHFQEFSNFSTFFGIILLAPLALSKLLICTSGPEVQKVIICLQVNIFFLEL